MNRIRLALPSPYVGLRPFEEHEALLFFGRDTHVKDLLAKLEANRFVAVLGPSGSGKSSLVRAGLIPALHRGALPRIARRWNIYTLKPGDAPLANLAAALTADERWLAGAEPAAAASYLRSLLAASPVNLVDLQRQLAGQFQDEAILLVIDQFEEIFRYRQSNLDEAEAFIKLLLRSADAPPIHVVITMRSDFLGHCVSFHGLPEQINQGIYLTPRLDRSQLGSVVASPLQLVGGAMDGALVARLINTLGGDDELPVLEHALLRMWTRAKANGGAEISDTDFTEVCQWKGINLRKDGPAEAKIHYALDNHAAEIYDRLTGDQQRVARRLFVSLTDRREGRDVRRKA